MRISLIVSALLLGSPVLAQQFKTEVPPAITIPDRVDTRLGTLQFADGVPDDATVQKIYDNLDFQRGVQAFLTAMPIASMSAMRKGLTDLGANNTTVTLFENLADSRSLFLTANTESVYLIGWMDLKDGPVVVETPPNVLAFVNDRWFHYVTDMGNAGRDKGKGGKYLFVPPGYKGELPEGHLVTHSATNGNWIGLRGFLVNGDPKPAVAALKQRFRIYPLAAAANPPATKFLNVSGKYFNTIHAMDVGFFDEVNRAIQEEPLDGLDAETLGLLASIGIQKGKPFAPDARMKKILTESATVANATVRTLSYRARDKATYLFPNSAWTTAFVGGSYEFLDHGARLLDARSMFFFLGTGITPAMALTPVGVGSQYANAMVDSQGRALDGAKTYRLHMPPNIPAKDFWSIVIYDTQTRSELQTDQQFPSLSSLTGKMATNSDGSVDLYFSPRPPAGKQRNWIQTVPGKSWFALLRIYGPMQAWYDKTWKPGELEEMK